MKRAFIVVAVVLLLVTPLFGVDKAVMMKGGASVDNLFIYDVGRFDKTGPITIPFVDGYNNPTKKIPGVYGMGRTNTYLNFIPAQTAVEAAGRCIQSEGFGSASNGYTSEVRDCTIRGPHDLGSYPYANRAAWDLPSKGSCIRVDAAQNIVENNYIFNWQGDGVAIGNVDFGELRISKNTIGGCINGVSAASDLKISDNVIVGCRDAGIFVGWWAGSVQSSSNHYFGHQRSIDVVGGSIHSENDVASDVAIGVLVRADPQYQGGNARCIGLFSQHNTIGCVKFNTEGNSVINSALLVNAGPDGLEGIYGINFNGGRGSIFTGGIALNAENFGWGLYSSGANQATGITFTDSGYVNAIIPKDHYVKIKAIDKNYPGGPNLKDALVWFHSPGCGNTVEADTSYYFAQSNSHLLRINAGVASGMKHNHFVFRGHSLDLAVADPTAYCKTITVVTSPPVTPKFPGTAVNDATGLTGTPTAWSNPGNATADDGAQATVVSGASGSQWLYVKNFNLALPTGALIEKLIVNLEASENSTGTVPLQVQVMDANGVPFIGARFAWTLDGNPMVPPVITGVGTWADAWGEINQVLNTQQLNDPDFGFRFRVDAAYDVRIDHVSMQVTYTDGTRATGETPGVAGLDSTNSIIIVDTDGGNGKLWDGVSWKDYSEVRAAQNLAGDYMYTTQTGIFAGARAEAPLLEVEVEKPAAQMLERGLAPPRAEIKVEREPPAGMEIPKYRPWELVPRPAIPETRPLPAQYQQQQQ